MRFPALSTVTAGLMAIPLLAAAQAAELASLPEPPQKPGAVSVVRDERLRELRAELGRRLHEAVEAGFSGSVLVTIEGASVLATGAGLADRDASLRNGSQTVYDVGSVMKDLTAAAIYKLQEAGKLRVTDTLEHIFGRVPADKANITLLHVLQHRAGFREFHDTQGDFEAMTRLEARGRIFAQRLLFAPGTRQAYSSSGFTLLADVVETVSGRAFTDYVRDALFTPAGMQRSGFFGESRWQCVTPAIGYGGETFLNNDPAGWPHTWALMGNGGLLTSVVDLERWLSNVRAGKVLGLAAFAAYQRQYLEPGAVQVAGRKVYAYAGAGDYGFGGVALDCPEARRRVLVATNDYEAFDIEALALALTELILSPRWLSDGNAATSR